MDAFCHARFFIKFLVETRLLTTIKRVCTTTDSSAASSLYSYSFQLTLVLPFTGFPREHNHAGCKKSNYLFSVQTYKPRPTSTAQELLVQECHFWADRRHILEYYSSSCGPLLAAYSRQFHSTLNKHKLGLSVQYIEVNCWLGVAIIWKTLEINSHMFKCP